MREIEFRGKTGDGRWIYGSLVYSESIQSAIYFEVGRGQVKTMDWAYVKPTSVGQYTGLRDKNGKKIYEGDVVKLDSFNPPLFSVVFEEDAFCLEQKDNECLTDIHYIHHAGINQSEVIGNIHDNPELIK